MIGKIRELLLDPDAQSFDVDSVEFSLAHRKMVLRKLILRQLFEKFYRECHRMDQIHFGDCAGERLELGSGAGIMKEIYPDVITSDLKQLAFIDLVLSAEALPFADESLRSIYAINVFHHLPNPRNFFREMIRVLHLGGGAVLIEPFYGPLAGWFFKKVHSSETFEPNAEGWETATGPFSNANQALSYIVFQRDRKQFAREFPELEVVHHYPHTHLWYVLSGGVNFRQLLPDSLTSLARSAEAMLSPLNRWIALQQTIVLRKKSK